MKWIGLILIAIAMAILLWGCSKTLIVYDSKVFKEQYLRTDEFRPGQMTRLELEFLKADSAFDVEYHYGEAVYMVITPEMIEVKKGKRYILKRKFTKKLHNTF